VTEPESQSAARQTRLVSRLPGVQYHHVSGVTLVVTYVVMVLGSYTGAIGAGLSCPDWPTCYGTWIPFLTPEVVASSPYTPLQIFAEWAHRGLAMTAGFLILGTVLLAWRRMRQHRLVVWTALLALALLPGQVLLGGLTVTEKLEPIIVTSHLATATLILVALAASTVAGWYESRAP
jgi:cytochrome c oxidase assembly protein subunit 15